MDVRHKTQTQACDVKRGCRGIRVARLASQREARAGRKPPHCTYQAACVQMRHITKAAAGLYINRTNSSIDSNL